ncbi:hypothetical protein DVH24_016924 [Malus domestica]|uniref:PGG domain-containing protein n=1 Tax=Malus domestica TaxID=3750 RepID=A0A498IX54_MALDO|nr:hypothetical protein DVH24_016924 [Malus domestica]
MLASLTPIYGEAAPKSRTRDLQLIGEGTCHRTKCRLITLASTFIFQNAETALWLLENYYDYLAHQKEDKGLTCLQLLAQMPAAFEPQFQQSIWKMLIYYCLPDGGDVVTPNKKDDVENTLDSNQTRRQSISRNKLAGFAKGPISVKKERPSPKTSKSDKGKGGDGGEKGPEAAETSKSDKDKVDDGGEKGLEAAKTSKSDKGKGNDGGEKGPEAAKTDISDNAPRLRWQHTILHQAADRGYYSKALSQKLIGPAMQLQEELRWMLSLFLHILHRNKKDQTAEELFNYQHNGLLGSAQEWVKETAQSCSTVAVLVSTVVFAAAYAIPGGTSDLLCLGSFITQNMSQSQHDQSGLPLLRDYPLFLFFTCMDVVGIACSLSSVAFFLSVLSSPLEYPYFVNSVPRKIMTGFILLFLSMASTMLAFAATILLLIRVEKKWTKSVLYPIACFPVPLFGLLQFPMYQSFIVMFRKIDDWNFSPLRCPLGFSKRGSIWGKRKAY